MLVFLTRRLVDVAQDVIITEDDCGTLRGTEVSALKKNDEIVEKLSERILVGFLFTMFMILKMTKF